MHWTKADLAAITGGVWEGQLADQWATACIAFSNGLVRPGALVIPHVHTFLYGVRPARIAHFKEQGIALLADAWYRPDFADLPVLRVRSIRLALRHLAEHARAAYRGRLIAVGGSVGKTSTTAMINAILTSAGHPPFPDENFNTVSGVVGQIANLSPDGIHAVEVSIGFHRRDLGSFSLKPHAALITTIADAHLEEYGSREAIASMKARIYDVAEGGTAIVPRDCEHFEYLRARALSFGAQVVSFGEHDEADFKLLGYDQANQVVHAILQGRSHEYALGIRGQHMAVNSLGALAAAHAVGLDPALATQALGGMKPIAGRGNIMRIVLESGTAQIFDEAYNANPTSVAAVLAAFAQQGRENGGRKLALLGDMRELGSQSAELHAGLAGPVLAADLDAVLTVGEQMVHLRRALPDHILGPHYASAGEVLPDLVRLLRANDQLLVKASHGTGLHEVVTHMRRSFGDGRMIAT